MEKDNEWEADFAKAFEYSEGWHPGSYGTELANEIIAFIRTNFVSKKKLLEEIEGKKSTYLYGGEEIMGYNTALEDIKRLLQ